jgi:ATP-dependent Zn protease
MATRSALEATAYHEAGHAVIGRVLGLKCGAVTIDPDDDSIGHAIVHDPWLTAQDWEDREHFRDPASAFRGTIMARMAGREAELEILGFQGDEGHYHDDELQIAWLLEDAEPWGDPDRFKSRLRAKARGLVRRHRRSIERVARALLERGALAREAIDTLILTVAMPRPPARAP